MKTSMWGQHLILDLSGCPKEKIGNGDNILAWVKELVPAIDMVAYGEPILEHFATHKDETAGYSLVQLIETSNIAAHFAENIGQVYIDIFSCKEFDEEMATEVCQKYFGPTKINKKNFERGDFFEEKIEGLRSYQSFPIDEIYYEGQTEFQKVAVYRNKEFGRMLILDGIIQTTESDEFVYHEMLTHVPMLSHHNPQNVLVIGGGDGGILREVLKYPIKHVDMVEIDREVIELSNKYLPTLNNAGAIYKDARVNLVVADAFKYLKDHKNNYDVIIVDSTDPVGPGATLFTPEFFQLCSDSLNAGGVFATQNGVLADKHEENLAATTEMRKAGLQATCYLISVPTYYGGSMALGYAVKADKLALPSEAELEARQAAAKIETVHYTPAVHLASFALPKWVQKLLK